jgi:protein TonB
MIRANPLTAFFRWFVAPKQHYLRWGVALSLCAHAAFMAWRPSLQSTQRPSVPALDVVLVNAFSPQAPLAPLIIAQENLDGGGEALGRMAANPSPRVGAQADELSLAELTAQRRALEAQQTQLLQQLQSLWAVAADRTQGQESRQDPVSGPDETDQMAIERNARLAAILEQIEQYNRRPRKYFDAPSAIANPFATYVDAWRIRIETTGSEHYPQSDGQRPVGHLQASITLSATGQVLDITIDRPAKDARLNQAVRRIIQLAEPFAPFPPELAREVDQLVITRTWEFTPGRLTTVAP